MFARVRTGYSIVTEAAELLQRIDDRIWRALPAELRWKVIPWAIDGGDLDQAERLIDATERERGESAKLIELRTRLAGARNDLAGQERLLALRAERYPSTTSTVQLARWLLDQGKVDRAAELYETVRQISGEQQQVRHLGAAVDRALTPPSELRARLHRELSADPDGFWPNVHMAAWLLDHDRADAARPLLHKVLVGATESGYTSYLTHLADLLERAGDKQIAADLRGQLSADREERRAELQAQIETALETVVDSVGDWELDEQLVEFEPQVPTSPFGSQSTDDLDETAPGLDNAQSSTAIEKAPVAPLDPRVFEVLQRDFGHTGLRDGQRQVI
jgi:thioredoxin-like negative regulator of GroEL